MTNQTWDPERYDKTGFVAEYGKDVIELLQPKPEEHILDLGCGTGVLTNKIAQHGSTVVGIDQSAEMIRRAKSKYPKLRFYGADAEQLRLNEHFNAVFSNAALHWMDNSRVVPSVWSHLKPGGRFVAEFGGKGNVATIVQAIRDVLQETHGIDADAIHRWYFPSIGEHSTLLERHRFRVTYALHFDRPTKLQDGEEGLLQWLEGFAQVFFQSFDAQTKADLYAKIAEKVKSTLFQNGSWYADYKRIRIVAVKPEKRLRK